MALEEEEEEEGEGLEVVEADMVVVHSTFSGKHFNFFINFIVSCHNYSFATCFLMKLFLTIHDVITSLLPCTSVEVSVLPCTSVEVSVLTNAVNEWTIQKVISMV